MNSTKNVDFFQGLVPITVWILKARFPKGAWIFFFIGDDSLISFLILNQGFVCHFLQQGKWVNMCVWGKMLLSFCLKYSFNGTHAIIKVSVWAHWVISCIFFWVDFHAPQLLARQSSLFQVKSFLNPSWPLQTYKIFNPL